MRLVVYGSFNCPYCYLASLRVGRLVARGLAEVEWRAVVHDPDVPPGGLPVTGKLADLFDQELDEVHSLLARDEPYPAVRPQVQPNTTAAVAGYAAEPGSRAGHLRRDLFDAYWIGGQDIGDHAVLRRLGCPVPAPAGPAARWRQEWQALGRPLVPMAVLGDGTVLRGLRVLKRLGIMERT